MTTLTDPFATVHKKDIKNKAGQRFWSKVDTAGDCWLWTGALGRDGYGRIGVGPHKTALAHRVSLVMAGVPLVPGLVTDHLCRNRACVNPAHLEQVTDGENSRRGDTGLHLRLRTSCPAGHPYDAENTRLIRGGYRKCIACEKASNAARVRKNGRYVPRRAVA